MDCFGEVREEGRKSELGRREGRVGRGFRRLQRRVEAAPTAASPRPVGNVPVQFMQFIAFMLCYSSNNSTVRLKVQFIRPRVHIRQEINQLFHF